MLNVGRYNMSNATSLLVGLGHSYFQPVANNQTTTDKIRMAVIGRLYAIALSFLLHTIATYHAARASISSLSRANPEEIKKCKQECNAAFRACINALFAQFYPQIQKQKKEPLNISVLEPLKRGGIDTIIINASQTSNKVADQPVEMPLQSILIVDTKSKADSSGPENSLTPMSFDEDSDMDSANRPSPPRSRSVPPIASPKAQKKEGSIIFSDPRHFGNQPKENIQTVVNNLQQSAFSKPANSNSSPREDAESLNSSDFLSDFSGISSVSSKEKNKNQAVAAPVLPGGPQDINQGRNEGIEKVSDCGSDGGSDTGSAGSWEKL